MAQQTKLPTVAANVDRAGNAAWTSPENVYSNDTQYANVVQVSDYLVCSSFGFAIPGDAIILGVTLNAECYETGTSGTTYLAQLQSNTTPTLLGSSKTSGNISGTTPTVVTVGSGTDLWSATLTPDIVNATGFGVSIWQTDTVNTLYIDYVELIVTYTGTRLGVLGVGGGG